MSMMRLAVMLALSLGGVAAAACGQSDYNGGGRRTDLGRSSDEGIAITVDEDGGISGNGGGAGVGAGIATAAAGLAGCVGSADAGQAGGPPCASSTSNR